MRIRSTLRSRWRRNVRLYALAVVLGCSLLQGASHAESAQGPEVKLDCSVYETKETNFGVAFKVAHFLFNAGPEFSFSRKTGIAWDKVVHGTIARYVELCNRYNAGLVTKAEYDARLKDIDGLYKETKEIEAKLYEATRQRARDAGNELDEALGRSRRTPASPTKVSLELSVEALADRVEQFEPIGQPLKPVQPCRPPDMLGAPGAIHDPGRAC